MLDSFIKILHDNPILGGGVAVAIGAWALAKLQERIPDAWNKFVGLFTVSMIVWSDDPAAFNPIDTWLALRPQTKRIRSLVFRRIWNVAAQADQFHLSPGTGMHVFREGWRFFFVTREVTTEQTASMDSGSRIRKQTLKFRTLGRSRVFIENIVKEIEAQEREAPGIPVWLWQGQHYVNAGRRFPRPLDTIYMDEAEKVRTVRTIQNFYEDRDDYIRRGVPWRLGIMFHGPTGTGKTSFIFALAAIFDKPIYVISPSSIHSDDAFLQAMNNAGSAFVVIEDIDSLKITEARPGLRKESETKAQSPNEPTSLFPAIEMFGLTLSGLLNGIDGLASREGRVLFVTTNTPEILDGALVRPGRIDLTVEMTEADRNTALKMWRVFFGDKCPFTFFDTVVFPISQAELQGRMIAWTPEET